MKKNAIFWIREDFRIENNPALSFASQNHDNVIALFIYNKNDFDKKREAQKWWLSKSLEIFKSELSKYKINLQVLAGDELDIFSKIKKKDDVSIYWNKIYEPDVIAKGKQIRDLWKQMSRKGDFRSWVKWYNGLRKRGATGTDTNYLTVGGKEPGRNVHYSPDEVLTIMQELSKQRPGAKLG